MKKLCFALVALSFLACPAAYAQDAVSLPQSKEQITLSFAPLVRQVTPAVVNIYTQKLVRQRVSPLFDDPFFRQFFGDAVPQGMTRERMQNSLGSGVIVRPDGVIVTSDHVIAGADQIRVVLSDKREFDAKVVMRDERSDLAILRLEKAGRGFSYLELRDSDEAQVGDLVLAIGNPFGVGQTVTSGIISALAHRAVGGGDLDYFIQTDAAINPGNSGGALVTMDGKLVGINASIYSRSGGNMGIGFAVPANLVRTMLAAVAQGKKEVTHPWMGIDGQPVTQDIAASLGLAQPAGFLVKGMSEYSPARKAGVKIGDVVVSLNGHAIDDMQSFNYRVATLQIGSTASFGVMRQGQKIELPVAVIAPPETMPKDESFITGRNPISGAKLANMSPATAEELGLLGIETGVVVTEVKPQSTAAGVGLQPGDLIVALNGKEINLVRDVEAIVKTPASAWRLTIQRGDRRITMMFRGN